MCIVHSTLRDATTPYTERYKQAEKKDNDTMKMKFLLHKDKEENGKPTAQKQECGGPSLQPSLRSHTHALFPAHSKQDNNNGEGNHPKRSKNK
jgi:hypothetical protein